MHRSNRHLYSITSSARASSDGGTVRPTALAAFFVRLNYRNIGIAAISIMTVTRITRRLPRPAQPFGTYVGSAVTAN
jgi:hypothetical protein